MNIAPVDNELNGLINSDFYREIINQISEKYSNMDTYINNLSSDISEIDSLTQKLERDASRGYDIGTSLDTLTFQQETLQLDRDFFLNQKNTYLRKIYKDMYKYTSGIVDKCISIEDNPRGLSDEEIRGMKMSGAKLFAEDDETATFTMSDIFSLLSVTEKNLYELAADIATFADLITDAVAKESRGFSVGNLLLNLKEQQSSLTLGFKSYCIRIDQFLRENLKFSTKCVSRVKMIAGEIVTQEELDQQEQQQNQEETPQEPQPTTGDEEENPTQ